MDTNNSEKVNKFGVPYHSYALGMDDDSVVIMDVGYQEDFGDVQHCNPEDCDDWTEAVGLGNDEDGHLKIVKVEDLDGDRVWEGNAQVKEWAETCVWCYTKNYSS